MCKCTPEIRTPYCGRGNCINPHDKPQGARSQLPQDVEGFIRDHAKYMTRIKDLSNSDLKPLVESDLRSFFDSWMTGHARVLITETACLDFFLEYEFWQLAKIDDHRAALYLTEDQYNCVRHLLNASKGE